MGIPAIPARVFSLPYDITGTSSHPHTLSITAEILATLQQTKVVDVDSSEDAGHAHTVRLTIA